MLPDVGIAVIAVLIAAVVLACIHGPEWLRRRWRRCDDRALRRWVESRRNR